MALPYVHFKYYDYIYDRVMIKIIKALFTRKRAMASLNDKITSYIYFNLLSHQQFLKIEIENIIVLYKKSFS